MRRTLAVCSALIGLLVLNVPLAHAKTAKECRTEWQANKAANQAAHVTEKAYVAKCRAGDETTAQPPAAAPAPTPASTTPAAKPAPKPAPAAKMAPTGGGQFSTEAQAKSSCAGDTVVWVNTRSKIYHFAGHRDYGNTKAGAYMCEKAATAAGDRAAKNEKHP